MIYGKAKDFIFQDALKFLLQKKVVTKEEYEKLRGKSKAKAFTVARFTEAGVLQEFLNAVTQAVEEGTTLHDFKKRMDTFLEEKGYTGKKAYRASTIFFTNLQSAYNAGHYKSMSDPTVRRLRPYWQYCTVGDEKVRPEHEMMNGKVFRADDPVWDEWFPPNGYGCRCTVKSLSERQIQERGLKVEEEPPSSVTDGSVGPVRPDKGFRNNPGKDAWEPDTSSFDPGIKEAFEEERWPWVD